MKQIASTSLKNLTQFYYREHNDYGLDAEENETNVDEEDLPNLPFFFSTTSHFVNYIAEQPSCSREYI